MTKAEALAMKEYKIAVKDIEKLTDIKGSQFVGIQGYTNAKGEVSNQCINTGVDHSKVLAHDLKKYHGLVHNLALYAYFAQKYGENTFREGLMELTNGCKTCLEGTNERSQAQKDAYIWINRGMKYCIATQRLMVYGYFVSKKVLVQGVYPEVKSRAKTLCKNEIKKVLKIKSDLYRQFIIEMDRVDCFMIAHNRIDIPLRLAA